MEWNVSGADPCTHSMESCSQSSSATASESSGANDIVRCGGRGEEEEGGRGEREGRACIKERRDLRRGFYYNSADAVGSFRDGGSHSARLPSSSRLHTTSFRVKQ